MAYCKHCGSKIVPGQKVCTQCGTRLVTETSSVPPFQNEPKKSRKIYILSSIIVAALIIALLVAFFVLKHQLSPEKDAEHIVQAIKHKDAKTLSKYLTSKDKNLTEEEANAFIDVLNQYGQLNSYADKIGKAILEAKVGHSSGAIVSTELKTQLFSAEKRGKKYVFFDKYVYDIPQLDVAMYSEDEGTLTYTHNGKKHDIKLKKKSVVDVGNFTMGNYSMPAVKKVNGKERQGKLYLNMSGVHTMVKEDFGEKRVQIENIENSSKFDSDDIQIYINDKNQGKYDSSKDYGPFGANEDVQIYAIGKYDKNKTFKTNVVNIKDKKGNEVLNGLVEVTLKFNDKEIDNYKEQKDKDDEKE
ncbi:TcaA second domain-containing protein [Staphylococcus petrasii]|uniref:TcaA second domain-containing protein n=1 Tax=Staphylococcus petrasii TaxID=1276936 RepID=UPI001F5711AA|nr:zinc-ribbon domain-containing protein [Staphylococcus petrasii]